MGGGGGFGGGFLDCDEAAVGEEGLVDETVAALAEEFLVREVVGGGLEVGVGEVLEFDLWVFLFFLVCFLLMGF